MLQLTEPSEYRSRNDKNKTGHATQFWHVLACLCMLRVHTILILFDPYSLEAFNLSLPDRCATEWGRPGPSRLLKGRTAAGIWFDAVSQVKDLNLVGGFMFDSKP